jgi:hypothetical protein
LLVELYTKENPNNNSQQPTLLGQSKIPLNTITNQDEYDIDLEITDEQSGSNLWIIRAKIILIWSYFKLYQDNYNKAEKNYESLMHTLGKSNTLLQNLNGNNNINIFNYKL